MAVKINELELNVSTRINFTKIMLNGEGEFAEGCLQYDFLPLSSMRCYQSLLGRSHLESWETLGSPQLGHLAGCSMGQVLDLRQEYGLYLLLLISLWLNSSSQEQVQAEPIYGVNEYPQLTQDGREEMEFHLYVTQESQVQISTGPCSPSRF